MDKKDTSVSAKQALKFCIEWALNYPWILVVMLIPVALSSLEGAAVPYFTKKIIDIATVEAPENLETTVLPYAIGMIIILFLWESGWRLYGYVVDVKQMPRLRKLLVMYSMDKLFEKSHRYYQTSMSGSLTKRIFDISDSPLELIHLIFNKFLIKIGILLGAIVLLWTTKAEFALIIIVWSIIFTTSFVVLFPKIVKRSEEFSSQGTRIGGQITDCFSNMLSIRLFANWELEREILNNSTEQGIITERKVELAYVILFSVVSYSFVAIQAIALYLLIKYRVQGIVTPGDFAMILSLNYKVIEASWYLMYEVMDFTKCLGKTQQALKDIYADVEVKDTVVAKDLVVSKGEIEFRDVTFKYSEREENTFENFNCKISKGQKVGIVGESGAGKTTFVNLLLRTFDVQHGAILIDGQDISKVTQDSLRRSIGVIPQDPSLFHRTLFENIHYGNPYKPHGEVYRAAKNAYVHNFIANIQNGYSALVGERGVKISGGQRQRIAIARAFLKNAPLLILDEATSALDSITEKEIQKSLWQLMKDKTCIVIAHRLSTLLDMDRILVFDKGKIVQDGTHEDLVHKKGIYKHLWDTQVNGFVSIIN